MIDFRKAITILTASLALGAATGCVTKSREELKNAAESRWNSARTGILYSLAKQHYNNGELKKAESKIKEALKAQPKKPRFHELAARISMERGRLERAFHKVERALALDNKRSGAHYLMGVIFQRWQQYDAALKQYEKAYELKPDDVSGLLAAAEMMVELGRTEQAVDRLKGKLAYFEHDPDIRVLLGRIRVLQGNYDQAAQRFKEASLLAGRDPGVLEHLAMAQYANGEHANAALNLKQVLSKKEYAERTDLRMALGDCYMALDQPVKARKVFLRVTQNNENDPNAWIKLGQAAWIVGDEIRLKKAARRVQSLAPKRHEGYLLRGLVERRAGRTQAAVREFDRAAQRAPTSALPWIMKGVTLERADKLDEAARAYEKALEISPDDPRPKRLLAGLKG